MQTDENLKNAYSGESQAFVRYKVYAEVARKKGLENIARVFEAFSYSEYIHAKNHLKVVENVNDVENNLKNALSGETYEIEEMYPKFYENAIAEGNKKAARSFRWALETEKIHAEIYKKLLNAIDSDGYTSKIYVCEVCGYVVENEKPDACPLCNAKQFAEF